MGSIVSILRAWGVRFFLLLDDDDAGQKAKASYVRDFLLGEREVGTLGDLSVGLKNKTLESLFKADLALAAEGLGVSIVSTPTKADYYLIFQALMDLPEGSTSLPKTLSAARKLRTAIDAYMNA